MPIVDAHCHVYPPKIAEKAVDSVGDFYLVPMQKASSRDDTVSGTVDHLLGITEGSPISHFIVHSVAVKPHNVRSINDFIASQCAARPGLFGFMAMHQDLPDPEVEIERACKLGLRGIKLHPDTQRVNLDDPRLMHVYEIAEDRHLPLIIHTGDYRYDFSHPRRMKNVLHTFPNLIVDAAHFGGWSVYDLAVEYMEDESCFMDVSSAMTYLGRRRTRELIELYGADRILFGSDFPMWHPVKELEFLTSLGLSASEYEKITWHNAERFLDTDIS